MNLAVTLVWVVCLAALVYALLDGYAGLARLISSLFRLSHYAPVLHSSPHARLEEGDGPVPLTIALPQGDSDPDIVNTLQHLLHLDYPEYEVVVVCATQGQVVEKLAARFGLVDVRQPMKQSVSARTISQIYRSPAYPQLVVVEKAKYDRTDGLNTAINLSRYPFLLTLQPEMRIHAEAVRQLVRPLVLCFEVDAVGGLPRIEEPVSGLLASLQQVEYLTTFPAGLAVPGQDRLPLVAGAFGAFRKSALIAQGGFKPKTGEAEMAVQLYRDHKRDNPQGGQVEILAQPVYVTTAPTGLAGLFAQRRRWQMQLKNTLFLHWKMLFNPRYGRAGLWDMPLHWLLNILGPFLECAGWVLIPLAFSLGWVGTGMLAAFLAAEILFGIVISFAGVLSQQVMNSSGLTTPRLIRMLLCVVLLNLGYRQVLRLFQLVSTLLPDWKR